MISLRLIQELKPWTFDWRIEPVTQYAHRPHVTSKSSSSTFKHMYRADWIRHKRGYAHAYATLHPLVQYSTPETPHTTHHTPRTMNHAQPRPLELSLWVPRLLIATHRNYTTIRCELSFHSTLDSTSVLVLHADWASSIAVFRSHAPHRAHAHAHTHPTLTFIVLNRTLPLTLVPMPGPFDTLSLSGSPP